MYTTKKKILCFGDSNTYGYNPYTGERYGNNQRWTKILNSILNSNSISQIQYDVIEEGKIDRTLLISTNISQPSLMEFPILFNKHAPLDYIILCVGTNDLKKDYDLDTRVIAYGLDKLIKLIKRIDINGSRNTKIIIVCPPRLGDEFKTSDTGFDKNSTVKSYDLPLLYKEVAKMNNCLFIDSGQIVDVSKTDGLHLGNNDHENLARAIASLIKEK